MNSSRYQKTVNKNNNILTTVGNGVQKHNKITIKNTVINVNMIEPFVLLHNIHKKAKSRTKSFNKQILLNKSERKKPEIKFYDVMKKESPLKTSYGGSIIRTQENYPVKTMGNEQKHLKYHSMKINTVTGIDAINKKRSTVRVSGVDNDLFFNLRKYHKK